MKRPAWLTRDFVGTLVVGVALALVLPRLRADVDGAFWLFAIAQAIWSGIKLVGSFLGKGISAAVRTSLLYLRNRLIDFASVLKHGFLRMGSLFKVAGGFFRTLWTSALKPFIASVNRHLVDFAKSIYRVAKPVIETIQQIRARVLGFYNDYIRPVIEGIDVARRALHILAELGLDGARKLDLKLARLEQKIQDPFFLVVRKLNEVLYWVNRVVTFDGVLQEVILFTSLERYRSQFTRYAIKSVAKPLTPEQQKQYDQTPHAIPIGQHVKDWDAYFSHGESWMRVRGQAFADDMLAMRRQAQ